MDGGGGCWYVTYNDFCKLVEQDKVARRRAVRSGSLLKNPATRAEMDVMFHEANDLRGSLSNCCHPVPQCMWDVGSEPQVLTPLGRLRPLQP